MEESQIQKKHPLASQAALLGAALIWGSAFSAQKLGAGYIGPFAFNAARFTLDTLSLLPLLVWRKSFSSVKRGEWPGLLLGGLFCALAVTGGVNLQQLTIAETGAGKSAFITGLYIVFVPLASLFFGRKLPLNAVLGVLAGLGGMALLTLGPDFHLASADLWLLSSVIFWTTHILLLEHYTKAYDPLMLAFLQFAMASVLGWALAWPVETPAWSQLVEAGPAIAYAGILSVGVGYTLQVVGQKGVAAGPAALIMSLETVAGAVVGHLVWGESFTLQQLAGCVLMLAGMVLAQLGNFTGGKPKTQTGTIVPIPEGMAPLPPGKSGLQPGQDQDHGQTEVCLKE